MARSFRSPRMASSSILTSFLVPSYRFDISVEYIERIYRNDIWAEDGSSSRGDAPSIGFRAGPRSPEGSGPRWPVPAAALAVPGQGGRPGPGGRLPDPAPRTGTRSR